MKIRIIPHNQSYMLQIERATNEWKDVVLLTPQDDELYIEFLLKLKRLDYFKVVRAISDWNILYLAKIRGTFEHDYK